MRCKTGKWKHTAGSSPPTGSQVAAEVGRVKARVDHEHKYERRWEKEARIAAVFSGGTETP